MVGVYLPELVRIQFFLPRFGEELSYDAISLFLWLLNPIAMQKDGRKLYLSKKLKGENWKHVLSAIVVVLESKEFSLSASKVARFEELLHLPLGRFESDRDSAIRTAFNGTNLADVMNRFQVSRATVYRAAKKRKSQD